MTEEASLDLSPRKERLLRCYERIYALTQPPMSVVTEIPVIGSLAHQAMRLWYTRSLFATRYENAVSGVSNQRLFWTVALALASVAFIFFLGAVLTQMGSALAPGQLRIAQIFALALLLLVLPYIVEGVATVLGTLAHMTGAGRRSLHINLNRFHKPTRNMFSPRQ